jgi:hypothetical protein
MCLRQMAGFGRSPSKAKEEPALSTFDRCLTLLVQGAVLNMPEINEATYKTFCKKAYCAGWWRRVRPVNNLASGWRSEQKGWARCPAF